MTSHPCIVCGSIAHRTVHHTGIAGPETDLGPYAVVAIVCLILGLLGSLLTAVIPH
jgi:hypothetical protein